MRIGIGLGSNLGDRLQNLEQAIFSIGNSSTVVTPLLFSEVYLTHPVDCEEGAPPFYNMVLEVECDQSPQEMLIELRKIETKLGRPLERERNISRIIDLDILYAGDREMDNDELTLPHPRISERRFVLQPLADIRPDLILPGQDKNIATLLAQLNSEEPPLERVPSPSFENLLSPSFLT